MVKTPLLATGLTGLVGSHFSKTFQSKYEFFNLDLTTGVDITNPQKVDEFITSHSAPVLIHFAAFTNVNEAFKQTGDKSGLCYRVNVEGTRNIVNSCKKHGIYLVHISTDFVFAGDKQEPYTEDDPRHPIEWYGQTKAWAEEIIETELSNFTILRIGYPFRAHYEAKPDIIHKILTGLKSGNLYPQFSDMIITPTPIHTFSQILDRVVEQKPQGIFHAHGSTALSPYELARLVAQTFGYDPNQIKEGSLVEYLKTTDRPYQQYLHMDNSKIQQTLNITIPTIQEALEEIKQEIRIRLLS